MAERICASARITRPVTNEGLIFERPCVDLPCVCSEQGNLKTYFEYRLTLDWASDIAAMMIPTVSMATLKIWIRVYRFPHMKPTSIVVTLPPLRRMICTGTEMLYPNA